MRSVDSHGQIVETIRTARFTCHRVRHAPGGVSQPHLHDLALLEVVIEGELRMGFGRERCIPRIGSAVFTPGRVRHTVASSAGASSLLIEILDPPLEHVVSDCTGRAWSINLIREIDRRESGWTLCVEGLILQGLGWLVRRGAIQGARPEWLDEAVALARRQQSLGALAGIIDRHPSHIAREFRRHEGVSVGEFSRRCRLELAAALLNGKQTISEVALTAGFCDQSHFTNAFRRVFGVTPAAYRQRSRRPHD
jgi:AraC-like DNA-binding protein/quercetin dioxygenase-like cupin family protein